MLLLVLDSVTSTPSGYASQSRVICMMCVCLYVNGGEGAKTVQWALYNAGWCKIKGDNGGSIDIVLD